MKYVLYLFMAWVFCGSFFFMYVQQIDGHYINKPITFQVDTKNLKVEKSVYRKGDEIRVLFSFCRNRTYSTRTTWKIINETQQAFPEVARVLKPECAKDRWVSIGDVPKIAVPGTHHLEGITQIQLNPLNVIYVEYRTEEFQVL